MRTGTLLLTWLVLAAPLSVANTGCGSFVLERRDEPGPAYYAAAELQLTASLLIEAASARVQLAAVCEAQQYRDVERIESVRKNNGHWYWLYGGAGVGLMIGGVGLLTSKDEGDERLTNGFLITGGVFALGGIVAHLMDGRVVVNSSPQPRIEEGIQAVACEAVGLEDIEGQAYVVSATGGRSVAEGTVPDTGSLPLRLSDLRPDDLDAPLWLSLPELNVESRVEVRNPSALETAWQIAVGDRAIPTLRLEASFDDSATGDGDRRLDPNEVGEVVVIVANDGPGAAHGVVVEAYGGDGETTLGDPVTVGSIEVGDAEVVRFALSGEAVAATDGQSAVEAVVTASEAGGFDPAPIRLVIEAEVAPWESIQVVGLSLTEVTGNGDGALDPNEVVDVSVDVRNGGPHPAEVTVIFTTPEAGRFRGSATQTIEVPAGGHSPATVQFVLPMREATGRTTVALPVTLSVGGFEHQEVAHVPVGTPVEATAPVAAARVGLVARTPDAVALVPIVGGALAERGISLAGGLSDTLGGCDTGLGDPSECRSMQLDSARREGLQWVVGIVLDTSADPAQLVLDVVDTREHASVAVRTRALPPGTDPGTAARQMALQLGDWMNEQP